jgi:hypothetical protein
MLALSLVCLLGGRASADDSAKAVVEKAIKAHGGEQNLTKFRAADLQVKGVISSQGMEIDFTARIQSQLPNKVREELNLEVMGRKIAAVRVFDGKKGWESAQGMTRELEGDDLNEMKDDVLENYVQSLVPLLKDKRFTISLIGDDKVDDKAVVGVKVAVKNGKDLKLFFDKDSGLLLKFQHKFKSAAVTTEVDSEVFFSDYKDVNGLKVAMKQLTKHDGKKFVDMEFTDAKILEKLDDSTFAKP